MCSGGSRAIVVINIVVIGSTSVYAVFRFVGVMMCVVLAVRTKVRRFAASTQLRSDLDIISWHEQFSRLQTSILHVSKTMIQYPLAVLVVLNLGLALGLFAYTFVRTGIFKQVCRCVPLGKRVV